MQFSLNGIIEWFKKLRYSGAAGIFGLAGLAIPGGAGRWLGFDAIPRWIFGVAFLGGFIVWTVGILANKWPNLAETWRFRERLRKGPKLVRGLSSEEKGVIVEFMAKDTNTLYYRLGDGVLANLISQGLVRRASSVAIIDDVFPFNLEPWVRPVFQRDNELEKEISQFRGFGPKEASSTYPEIHQDVTL